MVVATVAAFMRTSGASAAPGLGPVTVDCHGDGTATVHFNWGFENGARELWLDLSVFRNDFQVGTYISAGPFPTNTLGYTWDGIHAGVPHFWRVRAVSYQGETTNAITAWFVPCGAGASLFDAQFIRCIRDPFANFETRVNVNFDWAPIVPAGTVQWLDLSTSDNRFQPGTFISFGPLNPAARFQLWQNLLPGVTHYYRLNTLTANGWMTSETKSFIFFC